MRALKRTMNRGFTLIELMIVVAIVGVLAALAVYGVRKYLLNAKTAEVRNAVGQMAKDAKAAYERESMSGAILTAGASAGVSNNLCTDATSVPSSVPAGAKYQSAASDWSTGSSTAGWRCLKFSVTDPQYYQYAYLGSSGASGTFDAKGFGDLNGDSTTSSFVLSGKVTSGVVFVAPNFVETNPEE